MNLNHLAGFRDPEHVRVLRDQLQSTVTRPWNIMEICGGQTHAIVRYGLDSLLPDGLTLLHGPGCPVCVTPTELIDTAIWLACQPGVVLCSFGDMLRVPGSHEDLLNARSKGGRVKTVYSPLDAVGWAAEHPEDEVVFFAIGFETTAPANALAVLQARARKLTNFSLLVAQVRVPPAMAAILSATDCKVQGFLIAGHVCSVMGTTEYEPLAQQYRVPMVVTGFEPVDILAGVQLCVEQLEQGRCEVQNGYSRAVQPAGNPHARALIEQVYQPVDQTWRGLGVIPDSGLELRPEMSAFDATRKFGPPPALEPKASRCISGEILRGNRKPPDCPVFGTECTPDFPLGAPMVSGEGACAAYFRYRQRHSYTPRESD